MSLSTSKPSTKQELEINFENRYQKLNSSQKQAVDQIYGVVLVIAGPGSGKTELLSLRAGNILRQTDTTASSILCLTFTDLATTNMQKRLESIIGDQALKVNFFTFHSFCESVISEFPEYFFQGFQSEAIDELKQIRILHKIIQNLEPTNLLYAPNLEGKQKHLKSILSKIKELKKAGLTPNDFKQILEENQAYFEFCQPILDNFFSPRLSAKMVDNLPQLINDLNTYPHLNYFSENSRIFQSYHSTLIENLENVIRLAQKEFEETGKKTESLKTFKKHFLKKDKNKQNRLKDDLNIAKNFSLCDVYQQYQDWLAYQNYYDFEDMLLEVAQKMSLNPDLKYTLQERFQFIMVDEFQDTSAGQMAIINQLVDYENPNLMVVGDDDQSVFKFQGASLDNILGFEQNFEQVKVVVLDKNYRSSQQILDFAKAVVEQIQDRLTNRLNIEKPLISAKK